jgi:hypothetical protein
MHPQQGVSTSKYTRVFFITLAIFAVVFLFSEYLYQKRLMQIGTIEDNINRSILESEIQYALLADASCDTEEGGNTLLINELNNLTKRLAYMEDQRGADDPEVIGIKKHYSLLQVKDYLLLRERTKQCGAKPLSVLYFYSNAGDCVDCKRMGYVLTSMREDYADLHVYAFDFNLGLSAVETLKSIYKLENRLPVLVVNRKPYYGFKTREEVEALLPELSFTKSTSTKATTTAK